MINKYKNQNRNSSHSRENSASMTSKSKQKLLLNKYKSEKNLTFRPKDNDKPRSSKSKEHNKSSSKSKLKGDGIVKRLRINKNQQPSDEYYNKQKKRKSKPKIKTTGNQDLEKQKKSYFESLYMHKEEQQENQIYDDKSPQKHAEESHSPSFNKANVLKRMKVFQKQGMIDDNGKYVKKQEKQTMKSIKKTSQAHLRTISIFQNSRVSDPSNTGVKGESKKSANNLKMKKKIKNKVSQLHEAERVGQKKKIGSQLKSVIKLKKHTSSGKNCRQNIDHKKTNIQQNNPVQRFRKTRQATRLQIQRQTIQTSSSKTIQSLETESSPNFPKNQYSLEEYNSAIINIEQVVSEIQKEKEKQTSRSRKNIVSNRQDYQNQRLKAIDCISRVCHSMSIKREAHLLAVIFLDRYIEKVLIAKINQLRKTGKNLQQTNFIGEIGKKLKLFAITCLLLALKIDDGLMARKLCFEINMNPEGLVKTSTSKVSQKMKESIATLNGSKAPGSSRQTRKDSTLSLNKTKLSHMASIHSITSIKSLEHADYLKQTKKSKKQDHSGLDISKIIKIEADLLLRFNFSLTEYKSPHYWIDLFTFMWDQYLEQELSWQAQLTFRDQHSTSNISYLLQLLEKSYHNLEVYQHSSCILVLGAMYLLVRIRLEEQSEGKTLNTLFKKYRQNLSKSTNIIFCDTLGVNQLFGDFLTPFNLSLSDIMGTVSYIGQHLSADCLKVYNFQIRTNQTNNKFNLHQHRLSLYQYNCELYNSNIYR